MMDPTKRPNLIGELLRVTTQTCFISGILKMAAMRGWITLVTRLLTMAVTAEPMTKATAISTMFPREMNSLNPLNIMISFSVETGSSTGPMPRWIPSFYA